MAVALRDVSLLDASFLWRLLETRAPSANISHRKMPTREAHEQFISNHPYNYWFIVLCDDLPVGAMYLSFENEIGLHLAPGFEGLGIGTAAMDLLMKLHPRDRYLANVAPENEPSHKFFKRLGFTVIQHTYELRPCPCSSSPS